MVYGEIYAQFHTTCDSLLIVLYDLNSRFVSSHVMTNSFGKKPVKNGPSIARVYMGLQQGLVVK